MSETETKREEEPESEEEERADASGVSQLAEDIYARTSGI
jgi:hypothetical protein